MFKKMYKIEACRGLKGECKNSLLKDKDLTEGLEDLLNGINFSKELKSKLDTSIRHHHLFKIGISACPNGCSQPQIKDLGIIAKTEVELIKDKCIKCDNCIITCKEKAIDRNKYQVIKSDCLKCGDCFRVCQNEAIDIINSGYQLLAGGKLGRHPKLAVEFKQEIISKKSLVEEINKLLSWYLEKTDSFKKLGTVIETNKCLKEEE